MKVSNHQQGDCSHGYVAYGGKMRSVVQHYTQAYKFAPKFEGVDHMLWGYIEGLEQLRSVGMHAQELL